METVFFIVAGGLSIVFILMLIKYAKFINQLPKHQMEQMEKKREEKKAPENEDPTS